MKNLKFLKATTIIGLVLFLAACNQDVDQEIQVDTEKQEILDYLVSMDFVLDSVTFKNDMVFYESDMVWSKEHLLKRSRGEFEFTEVESPEPLDPATSTDRQRALAENDMLSAVTAGNVNNITYYIRSTVGTHVSLAWVPHIHAAAAQWNVLSNCRVNFSSVNNENDADIIITTDNDNEIPEALQDLPLSAIAATQIPFNGQVREYIVINNFWNWHLKMKTVMMHEMGHSVGFHHTGTDAGEEVLGTPETQSGSVMNPGVWSASSTLRSGDKFMARLFYPEKLSRPSNASVARQSAGRLRLTYSNPDETFAPYYWVRITKYTPAGQILDELFVRSTPNNNGEDTVFWSGHAPGQYRFAVRALNFKRDVWSNRTDRMLVTL